MGNLQTERGARRRRIAEALKRRVRKGARDERGAVAIIFALSIVVLVPMVLGLFDLYTAHEQRERLQDAVDAAALYAARSELSTDTEINDLANKALTANLKLIRGATLISSNFRLDENATKVIGSATIQPLAIAPALWTHHAVTVGTEVVRNSRNLEVALVLDVTGSMKGTKISDLRSAAQELVDIVVKDQQTPFYSKVAVVPWSMGVNVGSYADSVRGAAPAGKNVTGYTAWNSTSQKTVSGISRSNKAQVTTSSNHGFSNGDIVMISDSSKMTEVNGIPFIVADKASKTFNLKYASSGNYVNSSSFSSFNGSAKVAACARSDCAALLNITSHGFSANDYVYVFGMGGLTNTVDDAGLVTNVPNSNSIYIRFPRGPTGSYSGGGKAFCTTYGCEYYRFISAGGDLRVYQKSTCVTERTGPNATTDVAPNVAPVGFNYPAWGTKDENNVTYPTGSGAVAGTTSSGPNPCLTDQIVPLSTDKTALKTMIGNLGAAGSTAGQIGTAWGWYMVSPNFAYLWPNSSQKPAAYTKPDTIKVVVLMTDGALNSPYCNGVIAKNALNGSGSSADHENCDATNGTTLDQSLAVCTAMKAAGVVVYTVGFQITGDTNAETLMSSCATSPDHKYLPTSGSQLKDAFKAIGAELNNLRLAK